MKSHFLTALAILALAPVTFADAEVSKKQKCDGGKQLAAAKHGQCRARAASRHTKRPSITRLKVALGRCETKLSRRYQKLERRAPQDMDAEADDRCTRYGDADNVIAFIKAAGNAVTDGAASADGDKVITSFRPKNLPPRELEGPIRSGRVLHGDLRVSAG